MKYYICPNCGKLTTNLEMRQESEHGISDCYCEYMEMQWDSNYMNFQPIYFRMFPEWEQIPKTIFDILSQEDNEVIRLRMLRTIPHNILQSLILKEDEEI